MRQEVFQSIFSSRENRFQIEIFWHCREICENVMIHDDKVKINFLKQILETAYLYLSYITRVDSKANSEIMIK